MLGGRTWKSRWRRLMPWTPRVQHRVVKCDCGSSVMSPFPATCRQCGKTVTAPRVAIASYRHSRG